MYCQECGTKLTLRFLEDEGLVPYCERCESYKFPPFAVAVLMTVVNRKEDKFLLAKHVGQEDFVLLAGYIKKGETAEKAIPRELKEETKLSAIKWKYMGSRFHDKKDVLMLNFTVTAEDGEIQIQTEELSEVRWCTAEEAKTLIRKNSMAEYFLLKAIAELSKKK